ncbi:MAG: lysylphosphatidylglycerol synthase domain-containing protein, partial [Patescibacteria group bacterium]
MNSDMLKKRLSNFLTVITLIFFGYYLYGHIHILDPIIKAPALPMIGIGLLKILIIIISSLLTIYTLEAFGKRISLKESGYVSLLTSIGNYFGPILGGTGIRAAYLKRKFGFPYTHFIGTLYGYYLIFFFADALMGLLAILFIAKGGQYSQATTIFYATVFLVTGILMFLKLPYLRKFEDIKAGWIKVFFRRLAQVSQGWTQFSSNKKSMRKMMLVAFVLLGVDILTAYLEFSALNIN